MTDHLCDTAKKIDCITRKAALDFLIPTYDLNISAQDQRILGDRFEEFLKSIPAADVRPVVRAHWIMPNADGTDRPMPECSHCGWYVDNGGVKDFSFCPNCGADMRR